jgi:hypothetical protein
MRNRLGIVKFVFCSSGCPTTSAKAFDLSRFRLRSAEEHRNLKRHFELLPKAFDHFTLARMILPLRKTVRDEGRRKRSAARLVTAPLGF